MCLVLGHETYRQKLIVCTRSQLRSPGKLLPHFQHVFSLVISAKCTAAVVLLLMGATSIKHLRPTSAVGGAYGRNGIG